MTTKPMIGSYKNPKETKEQTPSQNMAEGIQAEVKDSIIVAEETAELAETYETILERKGIPLTKAHSIVDSMLEKGFYEDTMTVTKNVNVTFRTRTHNDYVRYLRALEFNNPRFVEEQSELQIRYFLAASLVAFRGIQFKHPTAGSDEENVGKLFDDRMDWIKKQPERVIQLLAAKLHKFDEMIHTVMSEGVVENF